VRAAIIEARLTSQPAPASHRPLDHTADAGVEIDAPSREALFVEAAIALADTLTPIERVGCTVERVLELEAANDELLLVDFLNEILFLFETEGLVFAAAVVLLEGGDESSSPVRMRAVLRGEEYDESKHALRTLIKAVTYHGLSVQRDGERYTGRVLFDL
jgi:SHS2 domain-containing protein